MVAGVPPSPEQPVMAAVLAAAAGAGRSAVWASHRSAAVLWGLRGYLARDIHLTAAGQLRLTGVTTHRVTDLPEWQRTTRHGIPVTTPARTLVDLAAEAPDTTAGRYKLEKAWDDAERRRLLTDDEVEQCAAAHVARHRHLPEAFTDLLAHRIAPCDGPLAKEVLKRVLAAGWEAHRQRGPFDHDADRHAILAAAGG